MLAARAHAERRPDAGLPRMQPDTNPMPFDGKRMIFGGFVPIVESGGGCRERRIQPHHRLVP
jgi:hypothetical protein